MTAPLLEATDVSKSYGTVAALHSASLTVRAGRISCLLGDNGAGKSTLIKVLSGVEHPDAGTLSMEGQDVIFDSPRSAMEAGIATVFQDLAVVPIMPVYRNFFLGNEPQKRWGPIKRFDKQTAVDATLEELAHIGINLRDPRRPIATLSGGERQCVAIARAVHFGARVLILDEPTSALGVRQAEVVLKYVVTLAHRKQVGVVLVTHSPHHAYAVGDAFTILKRGDVARTWEKSELTLDHLVNEMAGGIEFQRLDAFLQNRERA
jgi:simple sugar transport system ATP-binding protein